MLCRIYSQSFSRKLTLLTTTICARILPVTTMTNARKFNLSSSKQWALRLRTYCTRRRQSCPSVLTMEGTDALTMLTVATRDTCAPAMSASRRDVFAPIYAITASISLLLLGGCSSAESDGADAAGGSSGTGASPVHASCAEFAAHIVEQCPSDTSLEAELGLCEELQQTHEPTGCGLELARYVACATTAPYDCESGESEGCDPSPYEQCASAFTLRTGCARTFDADESCESNAFNYLCSARPPAGCTVVEPEANASSVCCPTFVVGDETYFD